MRFTDHEIQLATRLRGAGLGWAPHPGQYVFDIDGILKAPSPFQAGVHLISSTNAMESQVGGAESLQERLAWLPTWHDARAWLRENGVDRGAVVRASGDDQHAAFESGGESAFVQVVELVASRTP